MTEHLPAVLPEELWSPAVLHTAAAAPAGGTVHRQTDTSEVVMSSQTLGRFAK